MKRILLSLFIPLSLFALSGCGGGGDSGDKMNDYWVSAWRFAQGTKKIRLVNGPGYVTITPQASINYGPDSDDPKSDDKHPTWASATTVALEMVGAEGSMHTFTGNTCYYETDPISQTGTLTIDTINQPLSGSDVANFAHANLVEILGGIGRFWTGASWVYYRIDGKVTIHLDFATGTWNIEGVCTAEQHPTLEVNNGTIIVIRSY